MIHDPKFPTGFGQQPSPRRDTDLPQEYPVDDSATEKGPNSVASPPPGHNSPPRAQAGFLSGGVPVQAMEDVLAKRFSQIHDFGHTPEADAIKRIEDLPIEAHQALRGAIDYAQFHRPEISRRYLVKAGALILAAIDRLDLEIEIEKEESRLG